MPAAPARGPSARSYLEIDWKYPVYVPPVEEPAEGSFVRKKRSALTREAAFAQVAGEDRRPLLVLRECKVCNGTDDALLKGGADNEKTYLLSRWFHCVKLPVDVLEGDHPFHTLFTEDDVEHLFVCSPDGTNHEPLEADTSRTKLWKVMRKLIAAEYAKKPDSSIKKIAKILNELDVVDTRLMELQTKRDEALEEDGPKSRKLPKLAKKILAAEAERDELQDEVAEASRLELKRVRDEGHAAKAGR